MDHRDIDVSALKPPGVSMRVLPQHDPIMMSREGALHLFRLLQRYNWCLSSDAYRTRWAAFWPVVKPVERMLLVLFVTANCGGDFGGRMVAVEPPVDFEPFEHDASPALLTPRVAAEFEALLSIHYGRLGQPADVYEWLRLRCPKEFSLLVSVGGLGRTFGDDGWFEPERVRAACRDVFVDCGWDAKGAASIASVLSRHLLWFYKTKESTLC